MAIAGSLELQLLADVARLQQDMNKATSIVSRSAKAMDDALSSVRNTLTGLFSGVSAAGFSMWIKSAVDFADQLNDLNKTTNITVERLAGMSLMSKQTGSDLTGMAQAMNKLTLEMGKAPEKFAKIGVTAKDPLEAFKQFSEVFRSIEDPQLRAAVAAEALGKSWASAAPALAEGAEAIDAMVKRGEELAGITKLDAEMADAFNDSVSELQIALTGSASNIAGDMLPMLTELVKSLTDVTHGANQSDGGFSILTETMRAFIVFGGNVAYVITTIVKEAATMARQLLAFASFNFEGAAEIGREWTAEAEKSRAAFDAWEARMMSAGKTAKQSMGDAAGEMRKLDAAAKSAREASLRAFLDGGKAAKEAADAAKKLREEYERLVARITGKDAGVDADFLQNLRLIATEGKKAGLAMADIVALQEKYIRQQPYMVNQAKEAAKIELEVAQARDRSLVTIMDTTAKVKAEIEAEKERATRLGLTKYAISLLDAEKLELLATETQLQAIRKLDRNLDETEYANTMDLVQAYRDLAAAKRATANREVQLEEERTITQVATHMRDEFGEANRQIAESFTDALMSGGRSVIEYLKGLFRSTILRPVLAPIGAAVAGAMPWSAFAQGAGSGFAGSAFGSWASSVLAPAGGMVDSALGLFGMGSGIGGAAITAAEVAATATATEAALVAAGATATEAAAAAAALGEAAAATAGAAGSLTAALAMVPGWGWALAAALAVFGLSKSGGGPKQDGSFGPHVSDIGSAGTMAGLNQAAMQAVAGLTMQFESLTKMLGVINSGTTKFGVGISTDPAGDSPSFLDFTATRDGTTVFHSLNRNVGRSHQELQAAMEQMGGAALVGALQGIAGQLPQTIAKLLEGVNTSTLSADGARGIVTQIAQIATEVEQFGQAAKALPFASLRDLSFDAAANLLKTSGGLAALTGSLTAYYENFFTVEERRTNTARLIAETLQAAGLNISQAQVLAAASAADAKQQFRGLAESLEAGSPMWAALIGISGAFASIVKPAEAATTAAEEVVTAVDEMSAAMARLKSESGSLEVQLLRAKGDEQAAKELQRSIDIAGLTEAEIAVYDYNQALRAQITAINDAKEATERINEAKKTYIDLFYTEEEKRLIKATEIANTLTKAGFNISAAQVLAASASADATTQFRTLADSLDEGSPLWNAVMSVATAFSSLIPPMEEVAEVVAEIVAMRAPKLSEVAPFLSSPERNFWAASEIAAQFNAATGYSVTPEQVLGGSLQDFRELYLAVREAGNPVVANALLDVAGAFAQLRENIDGPLARAAQEEADRIERDRLAAEAEAKRIADERYGIETQLLQALGLTDVLRAREIERLNESNWALMRRVHSLADARAETDAAFAALERSIAARRSAAEQIVADVKSVFDTVQDAVRDLYGEAASTSGMQASAGSAFIATALATARASGYLPDDQQLQQAIAGARAGISSTVFASGKDADFARLVLAGQLAELARIAGPQLTEAEQQLQQLDLMLQTERTQVDALHGIDNSVKSVESAIDRLHTAMDELRKQVADGNREARRSADALNGNPEQPMLVDLAANSGSVTT